MVDLTAKALITDDDLKTLAFGDIVQVHAKAIVTPLASDTAQERRLNIERVTTPPNPSGVRATRVAFGADHGGFEMKEDLKTFVQQLGFDVVDLGTSSANPVDYPDYAQAVAMAVARGSCDLGIMIDGAGIGSCMVANKVRGVRAAMCYDEGSARNSREHNGANVLTLGGSVLSPANAREIVRVWLTTDLTEERHRRRVAKIDAVME